MEKEIQTANAQSQSAFAKKTNPLLKYDKVIEAEDVHLKERRRKLEGQKAADELEETRFGIAMSGGGIRSATINLGLLRTLNKFRILRKSDYLSTVSGGGYTGAHIQAMLKQTGDYDALFKAKEIDRIRSRGEYMTPGTRLKKYWNMLVLVVAYIISTLMSWVAPIIIIFSIISIFAAAGEYYAIDLVTPANQFIEQWYVHWVGLSVLGIVFIVHFACNLIFSFGLGISRFFNKLESALALGTLVVFALLFVFQIISLDINPDTITSKDVFSQGLRYFAGFGLLAKMGIYVSVVLGLILLGFFTDLNALSFHRFYRNQLAEAFLNKKDTGIYNNVLVKDLFNAFSPKKRDYIAPYPLINTCLNLQALGGGDEKFKGAKANDYFLLSPLYFGSKLTKYVSTDHFKDYRRMTLPAAMTISAAAVNPGMGMYSNKLLSVLMTIFNARFGFWISNPLRHEKMRPVWWPFYFFKELLSQIGTSNAKLNISDGGHIENLGVYELLRRKCRLIIAVDAGADADYSFADLENLTVRARNELGLEIEFRDGQIPEDIIRPKPSHGYSQKRFAIADIYQIWDEIDSGKNIKDRNYKSFEVIINYNDLKESIKQLDFKGRLLARIIFSVITEFRASGLLEEQLGGLEIDDELIVKELIRSEIFSQTVEARKPCVMRVLKAAIYKEPNKMRPILKAVDLLNWDYEDEVRLPEAYLKEVAENQLADKIIDIENVLLEKVDGTTLRQTYQVMQNFLQLLNGVRGGIEYKIEREFLVRKLEDEVIKSIIKDKKISADAVEKQFAKEPTDKDLIKWMKAEGMEENVVNDLIGERNRIRELLELQLSEGQLKMGLVNLQLDEMLECGVLAMKKLNDLFNQGLTPEEFDEEMTQLLKKEGYGEEVIKRFKAIRVTQKEKVESLMDKVSAKIETQVDQDIRMGTLVYVKSSVSAPLGKIYTDDNLKYAVYKYKIYHPSFPHESTADQFFDKVQWESYYLLGQYLGAEVLGVKGLANYFDNRFETPEYNFGIKDLLYRFDHEEADRSLFDYDSKSTVDPMGSHREMPIVEEENVMPSEPMVMSSKMSAEDAEAIPSDEELAKTQKIQKKVVAGKQIDFTI